MPKQPPQASGPNVPRWGTDRNGKIVVNRDASFWRATGSGKQVECLLCYRRCVLNPGEKGWCRYRGNSGGKMALYAHGQIGALYPWVMGYAVGSLTYYPGMRVVGIGALHCSAACSFCYVSSFSTHTERMPANPDQTGRIGGWYGYKTLAHPQGIVNQVAPAWNAHAIALSYNEPVSVSWEYSFDVCRLAQQQGLQTLIFTNGYATEAATRKLAPFVSMVKIGVKGSGNEDFYTRYMRSPGAMEAVYHSMRVWKESGVRVTVSDTIAAPQMQTDEQTEEAQKRLYSWVADTLGPLTVLHLGEMHRFNDNLTSFEPLLSSRMEDAHQRYAERQARTIEIAHECGLHYVENDDASTDKVITCHACDGVLMRKPAVTYDGVNVYHTPHEQHVTDGRCDHCSTVVPVATLALDVLAEQLQYTIDNPGELENDFIVREAPTIGIGATIAAMFR